MTIPHSFSERIIRIRGQAGAAWLKSLPESIRYCENHWGLQISEPFELSYNYVAAAEGKSVVVKVCLPGLDFSHELNTLKLYEGRGLCKLIDFIDERNVLLLEQLRPGFNLNESREIEGLEAVCSIIREMRAVNPNSQTVFPTVADWAGCVMKIRTHFSARSSPFREENVRKVEEWFPKLISTQKNVYVLHGDLHHENILASEGGWKAIDPKGVVGEVEYELIPFLMNNVVISSIEKLLDSRIEHCGKQLNADVDRIFAWGLCYSLLSAWWNVEDNLGVSELNLAFMEYFYQNANLSLA